MLGQRFVVKTDNTVVSHFLSQPKLNTRQARWQKKLAEFDVALEYKAGTTNHVADALSRRAELASCQCVCTISTPTTGVHDSIRAHLDKDSSAQSLVNLVKEGKTSQFWVQDDLFMTTSYRLYIPRARGLRRPLLIECHDTQ